MNERIGRYRILNEIGRGAMGCVWLAFDEVIQRNVAIKELVLDQGVKGEKRKEAIERFKREAQAAGSLSHPNIVVIYGVEESEEGMPLIVMEYLEGMTLSDMIRSGPLRVGRAMNICYQLCDALAYAHSRGVVHRDVKPDNLFILQDGRLKMTDFGIARVMGKSTMTSIGTIIGTPGYMSPEQIRGDDVDWRTDIFSSGVLMYEMLTGVNPFDADTLDSIIYKVVHETPPPMDKYRSDLPPHLQLVFDRACAKNRQIRFQNALEMKRDIEAGFMMSAKRKPAASLQYSQQAVNAPPIFDRSVSRESVIPKEEKAKSLKSWGKEELKPGGYQKLASSETPALIIYLIDISASMVQPLGAKLRIEVVTECLELTFRQMIFRSTKGGSVLPRYRIALLAYSDQVYDVYGGVVGIDEVLERGIPRLTPMFTTETAKAFEVAEQILLQELPKLDNSPAPLICHLTDGEYTGGDPEPIVRRIMDMGNDDGKVLVENIYISDNFTDEKVENTKTWRGVDRNSVLSTKYANKLKSMSSDIPESYRLIMMEHGFNLKQNAIMLFPGETADLLAMGFQMSAATPISTS